MNKIEDKKVLDEMVAELKVAAKKNEAQKDNFIKNVDTVFEHLIDINNAEWLNHLLAGAYNYAEADYLAKKTISVFGRNITNDDLGLFWTAFKMRFENRPCEEKMNADYGDILKQLD